MSQLPYHQSNRGVKSIYLRENPKPKLNLGPNVKVWDIKSINLPIPNDDHTHYWCRIFKAPNMDTKHHMIGVIR